MKLSPLCCIVAAVLSLCAVMTVHAAGPSSDDRRLIEFLDRAFDEVAALSPETLTDLGLKQDYGKLDDYTEAAARRALALQERQLVQMKRDFDYKKLGADSRLSYRLFEDAVAQARLRTRWVSHFYQISSMYSPAGQIPALLINMHRVDTLADAQAYVSRLIDVERAMREVAERARVQAAKGIVPPKFVYAGVEQDARKVVTGAPFDDNEENMLFTDFKSKVNALQASDEQKSRLFAAAEDALKGPFKRGYETFLAAVAAVGAQAKGNHGAWTLPDGAAFYADQIRYQTTTSLTPEQIHSIGLSEVARIHTEMRRIMRQVGFEGTLQEFFAHVKAGEQFHYPNTGAGKQAYLDDAKRYIGAVMELAPRYFNRQPSAQLEVRAVEPWREATASTGFYGAPAPDGSRPGIYYVNLADMREVLKPQIEALTYHEGAPGHHFQIALAQELRDVPKFRRFGFYGAYIEGWGLYAEKLAQEMGFYRDPYAQFGRLSFEIMRAGRLVVDSGIHAKRWSREQAVEYFAHNTLLSNRDVAMQIDRYFVMPGQAVSYKVGEMKILELRAKAQHALGAKFDIREFHDAVLTGGALPLSVLQERVDEYIAAKR
jgi:uncharacterized protein (DUF885 family)